MTPISQARVTHSRVQSEIDANNIYPSYRTVGRQKICTVSGNSEIEPPQRGASAAASAFADTCETDANRVPV